MVWLNGDWKKELEAVVPVSDGGLLRGEGVFETMLAQGGRVFELERHWRRLKRGCEAFGLDLPEVQDFRKICEELLERNGEPSEHRVRVRITRSAHSLLVTSRVSVGYPETLVLQRSPFLRNERSALSGLKAISYGENSLALAQGKRAGADEVLFTNTRGDWCEGAWSNVFAVEDGRLLTPPLTSGCLPGVTRELIIELAQEAGIELIEEARNLVSLAKVEELFLTSSLLGVGPVSQWDGASFSVGPVTAHLAKLLAHREGREVGRH